MRTKRLPRAVLLVATTLVVAGATAGSVSGCGGSATDTKSPTRTTIMGWTSTPVAVTSTPVAVTTTTEAVEPQEERRAALIKGINLESMPVTAFVTFADGTTALAIVDIEEPAGTKAVRPGMECVVVSRDAGWVLVEVK
jgi:phosphopantetheine adenylyltransferase